MICPKCGFENPNEAKFCKECGEVFDLDKEASQPTGRQRSHAARSSYSTSVLTSTLDRVKSSPIMFGIIGVAIIALIFVFIGLFAGWFSATPGGYVKQKSTIMTYIMADNAAATYAIDGKAIEGTINGTIDTSVSSGDGSKRLAVSEGTLYLIASKGIETIETDGYAQNIYSVSADAKRAIYLTENGLFQLNIESKKSKIITKSVVMNLVVSENGEAVAYDDGKDIFAWKGGEPKVIGSALNLLSISNDAKTIYGVNLDTKKVFCASIDSVEPKEVFNEEGKVNDFGNLGGTERMYSNETGTYFISKNKAPESAFTDEILFQPITPASTVAVATLKDKLYLTQDNDLVFVGSNLKVQRIGSNVENPILCEDNKTVLFIAGGKLYKNTVNSKKEPQQVTDKEQVSQFFISDDGKMIYIVVNSSDLFYVKDKDSAELVVTNISNCWFSGKSKLYYMVSGENKLYYTEKSKEGTEVDSGVASVTKVANSALYYTKNAENGTRDVYSIVNGGKPQEVLKGAGQFNY